MKIVIVNTLYPPYQVGGAERSVQLLAHGLLKLGHEVSVISLHEGARIENSELDGIQVWRLPLRNLYWPFGSKKPGLFKRFLWHFLDISNGCMGGIVEGILKEVRPDIIHTNNLAGFSVDVWRRAAKIGIPIVHTARDYYLISPDSKLFDGERVRDGKNYHTQLWSWWKRIASQRVKGFIGISNYVVDLHRDYNFFNNSINKVIYNSVEKVEEVDLESTADGNTVGYIGRLEKSKGLECVLEAMNSRKDLRMLVAGTGEEKYVKKLKELSSGNVKFLGRQNPSEFFKKINVLIVPSLWAEPLGRVVLEAYSYGIPVVASRIGGIQEVVTEGTGELFDAGDVNSLLSALKIVHRNSSAYRQCCIEFSGKFSEENIALQYLRFYQEISI